MSDFFPKSIICMTEESVETLYALGREDLIVGVSVYVERPLEAKKKPTISAFTHANIKKITKMKPDLVLGFSDIQKDIARDLIGAGLNVFIANHRSIAEILSYIHMLGNLIGEQDKTAIYIDTLKAKIEKAQEIASTFTKRPRVYIEEWDEPLICGIQWFSEIVEICGGEVVHMEMSRSTLAKDRILKQEDISTFNPDIILACWCGKKVDIDSILNREAIQSVAAIKNKNVFELDPAIFLQPGPAPIVDGIDILLDIFSNFQK
ncbi:ABC transporter substrate-binding protein [Halobacteriovorax sp. HLS]|uniref:ABC transporter substrate-binding protein n=1 Tax=Halobacteriovorax sp. HLS TaxID=2234000 RepID=UPI000FD7496A|nr:ABC transporter substrate-binding protein [Halobacteriovorax sp. HLS]